MEQAASGHGSYTEADGGLLSAQPSALVTGSELLGSPHGTSAWVLGGNGFVAVLVWLQPRAARGLVSRERGASLLYVPPGDGVPILPSGRRSSALT